MAEDSTEDHLEAIEDLVESRDGAVLDEYLDAMPPGESARTLARMSPEEQAEVVGLLTPAEAAQLLDQLPESQAATLVEHLPAEQAAAIVSELESDEQVDLIDSLHPESAAAILNEMPPGEVEQLEALRQYPAHSAGGLMITEFLSYSDALTFGDVVDDMMQSAEEYSNYDVQYAYVTARDGRLVGVLRLRDLVMTPRHVRIADKMIAQPLHVPVSATLEELDWFFRRHPLLGAPVVDDEQKLVGVVRLGNVEEALNERAGSMYLKFAGIIGGEELRNMPFSTRSARRLSWLTLNILLNVVAASVIALFQDTLAAVITLAVFLPMISDMSGCAGGQAVAVSMRELMLGIIRPADFRRVLWKEISLGCANGVFLGLLLGLMAYVWKGNPYLGVVVGAALAANTVVGVALGGSIPLVLRRLNLDAALISGPLLTTITDMCGFLLVLSLAQLLLPYLAGL